ncbi:MAG: hypothetical protein ACO1N9_10750 [Flavobacterium sp.]
MPYHEGVKKGLVPDKTASLLLKDSTWLNLDYVRDADGDFSCYGHLELNEAKFDTVFRLFETSYNIKNVHSIILYSEKENLCSGDTLKQLNVKAYLVRYLDKDRRVMIDYKNIITGENQCYHVSNYYATVINYFLRKRTGIAEMPAVTSIINKDLDKSGAVLLPKAEDKLYRLANKK